MTLYSSCLPENHMNTLSESALSCSICICIIYPKRIVTSLVVVTISYHYMHLLIASVDFIPVIDTLSIPKSLDSGVRRKKLELNLGSVLFLQ
jgi:hypothetical protein